MSEKELKAYCNKCGHYGPVTAKGEHLRPSDGAWCNYVAMPDPTPTAEKADVVEALPPLPKPAILYSDHGFTAFAGWQMEAYARAAIAALQSRSVETAGDICKLASAIPSNPLDIAAGIRDAALALADEPAGEEPTAWLYQHPVDGEYVRTSRRHVHEGWTETPLYARPATPTNPDRLVEALRPFARAAANIPPKYDDGRAVCSEITMRQAELSEIHPDAQGASLIVSLDGISVGDYRRAAALLSAAPALDGEKGE